MKFYIRLRNAGWFHKEGTDKTEIIEANNLNDAVMMAKKLFRAWEYRHICNQAFVVSEEKDENNYHPRYEWKWDDGDSLYRHRDWVENKERDIKYDTECRKNGINPYK